MWAELPLIMFVDCQKITPLAKKCPCAILQTVLQAPSGLQLTVNWQNDETIPG
jgi:hypothetical protein